LRGNTSKFDRQLELYKQQVFCSTKVDTKDFADFFNPAPLSCAATLASLLRSGP